MDTKGWEPASYQLPGALVNELFGEVNVRKTSDVTEVRFTLSVGPEAFRAEGWQTAVALDASASMLRYFGRGLVPRDPRGVPRWLLDQYRKKHWVTTRDEDGGRHEHWSENAARDAIERGYMCREENLINPLARKMTAYLAGGLDADGSTTVLYWGCGDGTAFEVLGDYTREQCEALCFSGPKAAGFGDRSCLTPALRYLCERFRGAPRSLFLFLTDGRIDDPFDVIAFTRELARRSAAGARNPVKCVLVGFGDDVDVRQMRQLDDLETGTGVDVWDHKVARDMRSLAEVFSEVVTEHRIVAPSATVYDEFGRVAADFPGGLPARVTFQMALSSNAFELDIGGRRTRQKLFG